MSVETFDPKACPVSMTSAAIEYTRGQLKRTATRAMRLGIKKSGCSGFMYTLDWAQEPSEEDEVYSVAEGIWLYIRTEDIPMVKGTEIDFVTEGLNSSIKFKNPAAKSMCGCGESFSL